MKKILRLISLGTSAAILIPWLYPYINHGTSVVFLHGSFQAFLITGCFCGVLGELIPNPPNGIRVMTILLRTASWISFIVPAIDILIMAVTGFATIKIAFDACVLTACIIVITCRIWAECIAIRQEFFPIDGQLKSM